jgi:hypothetical protein
LDELIARSPWMFLLASGIKSKARAFDVAPRSRPVIHVIEGIDMPKIAGAALFVVCLLTARAARA